MSSTHLITATRYSVYYYYKVQCLLLLQGTVSITATRYSVYYCYKVQCLLLLQGTVSITATRYSVYYYYKVEKGIYKKVNERFRENVKRQLRILAPFTGATMLGIWSKVHMT
jgi:hypothetical protein